MLNLPVVRFLGRISYSVYLLHLVVIFLVLREIVAPLLGRPTGDPLLVHGLVAMIAVPMTVPLAWALFTMIEKPFNDLGKRILN